MFLIFIFRLQNKNKIYNFFSTNPNLPNNGDNLLPRSPNPQ